MPLTAYPLLSDFHSNSTPAFFRAAVEIEEILAPLSAQVPMGTPLFNVTILNYKGECLGGVMLIAEATGVLLVPLGTVVSSKYRFCNSEIRTFYKNSLLPHRSAK